MSKLTRERAGAYDSVSCTKPKSIKYCPDNTLGQKAMTDLHSNTSSPDAAVINDLHSDKSAGSGVSVKGDFPSGGMVEKKVKGLFIRS